MLESLFTAGTGERFGLLSSSPAASWDGCWSFPFLRSCPGLYAATKGKQMCEEDSWLWLLIWEESDLLYAWIRYYSFKLTDVFFSMDYSRPRNQRFKVSGYDYVWNACRSVSELFEWQVSSVLGSYLPLKFSFLCFQFIFYLFWIICGRFISGHLSFKSVYLQDNYFNELLQLCFSINHYLLINK